MFATRVTTPKRRYEHLDEVLHLRSDLIELEMNICKIEEVHTLVMHSRRTLKTLADPNCWVSSGLRNLASNAHRFDMGPGCAWGVQVLHRV